MKRYDIWDCRLFQSWVWRVMGARDLAVGMKWNEEKHHFPSKWNREKYHLLSKWNGEMSVASPV